MKSKHILAIFAVLTLVVGAGFISYGFMDDDAAAPLKKDEPEMKRIQIIRSYQGQVSTFDTLVPAGSGYTEHDFLAELGFEDDKNLSFIRVSGDMLDMDMDFSDFHCVTKGESGDHDWNGNSFHMKLDLGELEEEINELKAEFEVLGEELKNEFADIKIEKRVCLGKEGENEWESEELEEELAKLLEGIGEGLQNSFNMDTTFEENGTKMRIMCNMSSDFSGMDSADCNVFKFRHLDGEDLDMDFDFDLDDHHNAFFFAPGTHCMKMDFECKDSENEDFTIVIVSEGSEEELSRTPEIEEKGNSAFEVYPNPTSDYVQIKLDFDKKKATTLKIVDLNGKVVMERDFGKFEGEYTERMDIRELVPGAYVIQVQHGNERLTEKLLVQ